MARSTKQWSDPYVEGDHEYDHSAGAIFVGLIQATKTIGWIAIIATLVLILAISL